MPGKYKSWLCGAALMGAAAMSLAAGYMPPTDGMNSDPGRMMEHLTQKLDLTPEQTTSISQLLVSSRAVSYTHLTLPTTSP